MSWTHAAPVDAEHELRAGLQGKERPQLGAAPEVQHAPPPRRASERIHERIEEVGAALLVAVDHAAVAAGVEIPCSNSNR